MEPAPSLDYEIVNSWPHDTSAFTQGLTFHNDSLFESSGLYGQSYLRLTNLRTGNTLKRTALPDQFFAEGITVLAGRIYQLTWAENKGFIYDEATLEKVGEFSYEGEGWGLTDEGRLLIMSDGTDLLRFLDPSTFKVVRQLRVHENGKPADKINELEYVRGEIYANIWTTDRIARIDPVSGAVKGWIDLTGIYPLDMRPNKEADLNGIAYDRENDRLFVTGKLWPRLFEIRLRD